MTAQTAEVEAAPRAAAYEEIGVAARPRDRANWRMLGLVWLVYAGFGIVSSSLPALITPIRAELGLTYAEVGLLLGAWQFVYILVAYPAGVLVDRVGTHRALALGALLIALSGLMRALATDLTALVVAVAVFGLGGPIISIGAPKSIASWFSGRPRLTAAGVYSTGSTVGSVVALSATNSLALPLLGSWQAACTLYGGLVAGAAVTWWLLARDPPQSPRRQRAAPTGGTRDSYLRVVRQRAVWLVVIVGLAGFMNFHGFRSWLPQILELKGLSAADAGYLAAVPGVSAIVGCLVLSRLAAKVGRKRLLAGCLVAIGLALLVVDGQNGPVLVAALVAQGFFAGGLGPVLLTMLMDLRGVGAEAMGAAAGMYFALGEVGGFSAPLLIGILKDLTGGFTAGLLMLSVVSLAMLFPTAHLQESRA